MNISEELRKHFPFLIFYLILLFTGISVYDDYGVSWDESDCRINIGLLSKDFAATGNSGPLLNDVSKYHGPAFEIFLIELENKLGLKDRHEIFLMRHLAAFLLFAAAVLFFYIICLKYFKQRWLALAGCAFLVLYPRIFADSFYNQKDLAFLSVIIINIYTSIIFFEKKSISSGIFHAVVSAIVIDIRIMGMIVPLFTYLAMLIDFIRHKELRKKIISSIIIFTLLLIGFVILFWPILWLGPAKHFISALTEMSKYPWDSKVFYNGIIYRSTQLPWHYMPVWILITTPFLYIVLFIFGLFSIIIKTFQGDFPDKLTWLTLYIFFVPLSAVIFLHSVVYDGWRHLYFIYPCLVLICLKGISYILSNKKISFRVKSLVKGGIVLFLTYIAFVMIRLHPFENVYFNLLAGKSLAEARDKYEVDYWALSYKQGFEYILESDTSNNIFVKVGEPQPGNDNMMFLPRNERGRISITESGELADYFLTCYRFHHELKKIQPAYSVIRDGGIIHSVFDLRNHKIQLKEENKIAGFKNDFENSAEHFQPVNSTAAVFAFSGTHAEFIDTNNLYGGNFTFNPPEELTIKSPKTKYLWVSVNIRSSIPYNPGLVIQIDSADAKTYYWNSLGLQSEVIDKWIKHSFKIKLPEIYSTSDIVKVYIGNFNKNRFYIDDFSVDFYAVDKNEAEMSLARVPL